MDKIIVLKDLSENQINAIDKILSGTKELCECDGGKEPYGFHNGYEYVDLGLPSGTLWAKCNVGAKVETDFGDYFAWGETKPKKNYTWDSYYFGKRDVNKYSEGMCKYNYADKKTVLDLSDDTAHVNMGGSWRMPTQEQFKELIANTTSRWVANYKKSGVNGRLFTSKKNGNTLFVPAAGNASFGFMDYVGSSGHLWSSSLHSGNVDNAWRLYFGSYGQSTNGNGRDNGMSVRGVLGLS